MTGLLQHWLEQAKPGLGHPLVSPHISCPCAISTWTPAPKTILDKKLIILNFKENILERFEALYYNAMVSINSLFHVDFLVCLEKNIQINDT